MLCSCSCSRDLEIALFSPTWHISWSPKATRRCPSRYWQKTIFFHIIIPSFTSSSQCNIETHSMLNIRNLRLHHIHEVTFLFPHLFIFHRLSWLLIFWFSWLHDFLFSGFHDFMTSYLLVFMTSWLLISWFSWLYDFLSVGFHDYVYVNSQIYMQPPFSIHFSPPFLLINIFIMTI